MAVETGVQRVESTLRWLRRRRFMTAQQLQRFDSVVCSGMLLSLAMASPVTRVKKLDTKTAFCLGSAPLSGYRFFAIVAARDVLYGDMKADRQHLAPQSTVLQCVCAACPGARLFVTVDWNNALHAPVAPGAVAGR